jgi:hypothetical protein
MEHKAENDRHKDDGNGRPVVWRFTSAELKAS